MTCKKSGSCDEHHNQLFGCTNHWYLGYKNAHCHKKAENQNFSELMLSLRSRCVMSRCDKYGTNNSFSKATKKESYSCKKTFNVN